MGAETTRQEAQQKAYEALFGGLTDYDRAHAFDAPHPGHEGPPISAPKPAQAADTTAEDQQRLDKYRAWKRHIAGGGAISSETAAWMRTYRETHPEADK